MAFLSMAHGIYCTEHGTKLLVGWSFLSACQSEINETSVDVFFQVTLSLICQQRETVRQAFGDLANDC